MKKIGIFSKVFAYTMVLAALLVCVTAALFSQQFMSFYRTMQSKQIIASYEPLINRIQRNNYSDIAELAQQFYENNQSFEFNIVDGNGDLIYTTPNIAPQEFVIVDHDVGSVYAAPNSNASNDFDFYYIVHKDIDYSIIALNRTGVEAFNHDLFMRVLAAIAAMLALCLICAVVFAGRMTGPIKRLADDAGKMKRLEDVPQNPSKRRDELGDLSRDIHAMYDKLKETISQLENEILRVKEMEEAQRYFFSAASHELKTPIAATGVLLEGMIANVGEYKDHPKYLRECVRLMDAQGKLVSEILETVNLIDGKIIPVPERLKLQDVVTAVLPDYQTLAESADQQIHVNIPGEEIVFVDGNMLKKVLSNAVLNAVQNAPPKAEIRLWSESTPNDCRLYVLNTNTHIDEEILPKLFDPFYRADKARNRKDNRSGLGLTIVQKTLGAMDADFSLDNTAEGVLFWVELPKA